MKWVSLHTITSVINTNKDPSIKEIFVIFFLFLSLGSYATPVADMAQKACSNPAPFILVDVFKIESVTYGHQALETEVGAIDVDGDGINDVLHGDFVSRVFQTSGHKLERFGLRAYSEREIKAALGDLRYLISIGKIPKPAGIIMPISFSLAPEVIASKYLSIPSTINNISEFKDKFQKKVLEVDGPGTKFIIIKSFFDSFKDLGVPFFVPAGNNYSTKINMSGLLGAEAVGATNYHGTKIAAYSDQSAITTIYRNGDILSYPVKDGIDLNLDGVPDFMYEELSHQEPLVINRKNLNLPILENYDSSVPEFFMKSKKFNTLYGISDESILTQIDLDFGEYIHFPSGHYYRKNEKGEMIFSPIISTSFYTQYNYGTSFAVGNICH